MFVIGFTLTKVGHNAYTRSFHRITYKQTLCMFYIQTHFYFSGITILMFYSLFGSFSHRFTLHIPSTSSPRVSTHAYATPCGMLVHCGLHPSIEWNRLHRYSETLSFSYMHKLSTVTMLLSTSQYSVKCFCF